MQDALPGSNRGRLASAIIADPIEQVTFQSEFILCATEHVRVSKQRQTHCKCHTVESMALILYLLKACCEEAMLLSEARTWEQGQEPESLKRPVDNGNANPAVKQRNKRLFGSLLGTLQKFQ